MRALGLMALGTALLAGGCSFTTAGGLTECETSADCGSDRVCTAGFCLPQPDGCDRVFGATSAADAIPLGALIPLTNKSGADDSEEQGLNALKLALDEVNQLEGVGGKRFVLYVCDTQADPEIAKEQAQWLVDDKKVPALFSAGSAQTIGVSSITVPKGVLVMSHTATSAAISNLSDKNGGPAGLVWRTAPSDVLQGRVIADILLGRITINDPGVTFTSPSKVGMLYVNDAYGQGLYSSLLDRLQSSKDVNGFQYTRSGDVSAAVSQLVGYQPNLTVLAGFPDDNAKIVSQSVSGGLTKAKGHQWFLTDASKDLGLFTALGANKDEMVGAYGTAPAAERKNDSVYTLFASRFQSAYKADPGQFSYTAHGYDAMYLVALGTAFAVGPDVNAPQPITGNRIAEGLTHVTPAAGSTGISTYNLGAPTFTAAREEMRAGKVINARGASGELDFDNELGEAPSPYELWKVENGSFKTLQLINPPTD